MNCSLKAISLTYSATITPKAEGLVEVIVNEGAANTAANNSNSAAAPLEITYDKTQPTLVISTDAPSLTNKAFTTTFTFSEAITGFTIGDIISSNADLGDFQQINETTYSALVSPSNDGLVTIDIDQNIALDLAKNGNQTAEQLQRSYDKTAPTVVISAPETNPVNTPFTAIFTFSEPIYEFVATDVLLHNASIRDFTATSTSQYSALITPTNDGIVTINVAKNIAIDAAGNENAAASQLSRLFDATQPTLVISTDAPNLTNKAFIAIFTFSKPIYEFVATDVLLNNASIRDFQQISETTYSALVSPINDGTVTIDVNQNVALDLAGNGNQATEQLQRSYDKTAPTVVITAPETNPINAAFTANFTFSEAITGFTSKDIVPVNAEINDFQQISEKTYSALVSPINDGLVTIDINQEVALDLAGNGNQAAQQLQRSYDKTAPTVMISAPEANPINAAFTANFTFSEAVTGFTSEDIVPVNAEISDFQQTSETTYSALVSPINDGLVTIDVKQNVALDLAGNGNQAAELLQRNYDKTAPTVVISAPEANPINDAFTASFTFSEAITGFTSEDIKLTNAMITDFQQISETAYSALVSPINDGTVTIDVNQNVALDLAGNGNQTAEQLQRSYDKTAPTVVISAPETNPINAAFNANFTFSEAITGFTSEDIVPVNAEINDFQQTSETTYSALVSPINDGAVTIDVNQEVALDLAGNGNQTAEQLQRSYDKTAPTVVITTPENNPINAAFTASFTFSEEITGFTIGDILPSNAKISDFQQTSETTYSALVSPINDGLVTIDINQNVALDLAGNGNQAAEQLQRSYDKTAPTVICKDLFIALDSEGNATISVQDIDGGSYDASGIASIEIDQPIFTCEHIGENTITLKATDKAGNTAECQAKVFINTPATILTKDIMVLLKNKGEAVISPLDIDAGSFSPCGITSVTIQSASLQ